ncbi:LysR substrate-binding domain-containing protein [Actinomadura sp. NPDC000600]|uniref:LysR family transcriptional regulator n=1 Tax=Actinomadura sp. NPDC000600 TaxID=3154262 RepID=UPI0033913ED5
MLDVHRLMVLRSVVETGSIQAAAAHLGYSPSAISQHLAALQRETGTVLMERIGRGVRPTAAGRLLATHAERIQNQISEAETALADLRAGKTRRLVIRYFATAGATLIPPVMVDFSRRFPDVRVDLRLGKGLGNEGADAEILVLPGTAGVPAGFRAIHLLDDPYGVVLPPGHPLAGEEKVELARLSREPWIDNETPSTLCREIVLDACGAAGFSPHFAVEAHDYSSAVAFVAAGLGVTVLPRLALSATATSDLTWRPVVRPIPQREIYVVVKEHAAGHPALAAFVALLQAEAAQRSASITAAAGSRRERKLSKDDER